MSARPSFSIVLHAHLPWVVGHGRWPHGTDWLCEAVVETYLPLWRMLFGLAEARRAARLTLGLTPILCEQLTAKPFRDDLANYLDLKREAAAHDAAEFRAAGFTRRERMAERWLAYFEAAQRDLAALGWNLVSAFRDLEQRGALEIMTCAATHGYLPLLGRQSAIRAQVRAGVEAHRRHFGREPRGIWLPECAYRPSGPWYPAVGNSPPSYRPGLEEFLAAAGLEYFIVDTHLLAGSPERGLSSYLLHLQSSAGETDELLTAVPRPPAMQPHPAGVSPYQPYRVGAMHVFARDPRTSKLVWSAREGYPGDGLYLEFHKRQHPGGLRYWRVTSPSSDLGGKEDYDEQRAREQALHHAEHFAGVVKELLRELSEEVPDATVVAPYDAELFGHWWFEGPIFLERVLTLLSESDELRLTALGDGLAGREPGPEIRLPEGSWGEGGAHQVWLNTGTRFVWRIIYEAEQKFEALARTRADRAGRLEGRVLRQLARTLLLLEASDWPFLVTSRTAHDYAELRVLDHHEDFNRLYAMARHLGNGGAPTARDLDALEALERTDAVFPEVDPSWWR
jgi:1,4-alpha-glucan branching enzyme